MPPPLAKKPNQLAILSKKLEVRTINASVRDDFTSFINVDATDIPPYCTPLEWWCQSQQRSSIRNLAAWLFALFLSQQSHRSRRGRFLGKKNMFMG
jgi:hypothetical protein